MTVVMSLFELRLRNEVESDNRVGPESLLEF